MKRARRPNEIQLRILAVIGTGEVPGREIARRLQDETGYRVNYGTLYVTLQRLRDEGWVTYSDSEDADGRIRVFRVTGAGARARDSARSFFRDLSMLGLSPGSAS